MNESVSLNFLKRAADRNGFVRVRHADANVPTLPANIVAVPFFGDLRSTCIFSSFILNNYKETNKSRYIVACTWPGWETAFPYADEIWSLRDIGSLQTLASNARSFYNTSDLSMQITRNLIQHFDTVLTPDDIATYYQDGIQAGYWDTFREVRRHLPEVPSLSRTSETFRIDLSRRKAPFVVVHPGRQVRTWERGKLDYLKIGKEFWSALIERLIAEGFTPVVYQDGFAHDMSVDFADRCVYLTGQDIGQVMASLRAAGCVLDVHTGVSRLAALARCPYVVVDERERYARQRDDEIDDLMPEGQRRTHIWSFSRLILSGTNNEWNASVIDTVVARLRSFLGTEPLSLGTSASHESVSYERVRVRKARRMGVRFVRKH